MRKCKKCDKINFPAQIKLAVLTKVKLLFPFLKIYDCGFCVCMHAITHLKGVGGGENINYK